MMIDAAVEFLNDLLHVDISPDEDTPAYGPPPRLPLSAKYMEVMEVISDNHRHEGRFTALQ